jgi:hypothetical protein
MKKEVSNGLALLKYKNSTERQVIKAWISTSSSSEFTVP